MFSYRSNIFIQDYCRRFFILRRLDSDFYDTDFQDALDDVRYAMWRYKSDNGKVWKGLDSPSQNQYKLYYQWIVFSPIADQLIEAKTVPPIPPHEFTNNEHKALKSFAGALEATQEFVPDSWFSPADKLRADTQAEEALGRSQGHGGKGEEAKSTSKAERHGRWNAYFGQPFRRWRQRRNRGS